MDIQIAVQTITQALKNDEGLFHGYQDNIAIALYDEVKRHDVHISDEKLKEITNSAAKSFLQLWVGQAIPAVETIAEAPIVKETTSKKLGKK